MYCTQCGNTLPDNAKFCPACGAKTANLGHLSKPKMLEIPDAPKSSEGSSSIAWEFVLGWVMVVVGVLAIIQILRIMPDELDDIFSGDTAGEVMGRLLIWLISSVVAVAMVVFGWKMRKPSDQLGFVTSDKMDSAPAVQETVSQPSLVKPTVSDNDALHEVSGGRVLIILIVFVIVTFAVAFYYQQLGKSNSASVENASFATTDTVAIASTPQATTEYITQDTVSEMASYEMVDTVAIKSTFGVQWIDFMPDQTVLWMEYYNAGDKEWININQEAYLRIGSKKVPLVSTVDIPVDPGKRFLKSSEKTVLFGLIFGPINSENLAYIDFIECENNSTDCFNVDKISILQYGRVKTR